MEDYKPLIPEEAVNTYILVGNAGQVSPDWRVSADSFEDAAKKLGVTISPHGHSTLLCVPSGVTEPEADVVGGAEWVETAQSVAVS